MLIIRSIRLRSHGTGRIRDRAQIRLVTAVHTKPDKLQAEKCSHGAERIGARNYLNAHAQIRCSSVCQLLFIFNCYTSCKLLLFISKWCWKAPVSVFTRACKTLKLNRPKRRPSFPWSRIRPANRARIRPISMVLCERKADLYEFEHGLEFVRSRVNVV
jgi:hypothetical protein